MGITKFGDQKQNRQPVFPPGNRFLAYFAWFFCQPTGVFANCPGGFPQLQSQWESLLDIANTNWGVQKKVGALHMNWWIFTTRGLAWIARLPLNCPSAMDPMARKCCRWSCQGLRHIGPGYHFFHSICAKRLLGQPCALFRQPFPCPAFPANIFRHFDRKPAPESPWKRGWNRSSVGAM